jgi:hypothetical protein
LKRGDTLDVQVVANALYVLQGTVILPDLAGLDRELPVRGELCFGDSEQKTVNIFGHADILDRADGLAGWRADVHTCATPP